MLDKVKKFINDNNLIEKDDKVLVALSGGPDSVCMIHILHMLKKDLKIKLGAIHINHMLRGDEADEDENYVKRLCTELEVECYIERINIKELANNNNISLEMAGREARYGAFERIKQKYGYNKIAVAHNANDQAETILMRMMRGTGLEGLTGIKAKRDGSIIRPILCLTREEIEKYCEENFLNPRIDQSNYERVYSRNKVRLDILPYMKENFNEDIVETLNRMALLLQKDNEFIESQAKEKYKMYCKKNDGKLIINKNLFANEEEALISRVLKIAFKKISDSHQNFEMKHIYEMIELFNKGTGKKISLTNGIIAENLYGDVVLENEKNKKNRRKTDAAIEVVIDKNQLEEKVDFGKYLIEFSIENIKNKEVFSNNTLIKYFDYDKIKERVIIRNRKDGDRIKPLGVNGSKKLKDLFIDLKIPREEREEVPIVCFDDEISWVVNYKVSDTFKITKTTKRILKIEFIRKE